MPNAPSRQRRSKRHAWRAPVVVTWQASGGVRVREQAETEVVNAHGALLTLDATLRSGKQVDLFDPRSHQSKTARVVSSTRDQKKNKAHAGVELDTPSESFWGLYLPF